MHGVNPEIGRVAATRGRRLRQVARGLVFVAAGALIGGVAVWYGWSWWTLGRFIESTDDAYVGGEVTTSPRRFQASSTRLRSPITRRSERAICSSSLMTATIALNLPMPRPA
jgi:hypothetical protein